MMSFSTKLINLRKHAKKSLEGLDCWWKERANKTTHVIKIVTNTHSSIHLVSSKMSYLIIKERGTVIGLNIHSLCPVHIWSWNGIGFTTACSWTYVKIMSSIDEEPCPWLFYKSFQRLLRIIFNTMEYPYLLEWENMNCLYMTMYCLRMPNCVYVWGLPMDGVFKLLVVVTSS